MSGGWGQHLPGSILSWTGPSPTTWKPFGLLHYPERRRETKAGSASTRVTLPSIEWQLARWLGGGWAAFSLKGAKVYQSPFVLDLGFWRGDQNTRGNTATRSRRTQPKGTLPALHKAAEQPEWHPEQLWPALPSVFPRSHQVTP